MGNTYMENTGISSPPQYDQDHRLKFLGQLNNDSYHANHSVLKGRYLPNKAILIASDQRKVGAPSAS
jgi:hypothetical protein